MGMKNGFDLDAGIACRSQHGHDTRLDVLVGFGVARDLAHDHVAIAGRADVAQHHAIDDAVVLRRQIGTTAASADGAEQANIAALQDFGDMSFEPEILAAATAKDDDPHEIPMHGGAEAGCADVEVLLPGSISEQEGESVPVDGDASFTCGAARGRGRAPALPATSGRLRAATAGWLCPATSG